MPRPVRSKRDFVRRYKAGEFGNAAPTWDDLGDWLGRHSQRPSLPDSQLYHIRNRVAGGATWYDLGGDRVEYKWEEAIYGFRLKPSDLYISAMAPHNKGLIQGEVRRTFIGLEYHHTPGWKPMREAVAEYGWRVYKGLTAQLILKKKMDPLSYEWLEYLLEVYPDHIVEFSTFDVNWGTIPNRNTVVWEIRPDRGLGSNLSEFTEVY